VSSSAPVRVLAYDIQYEEVATRTFLPEYMDQQPPLMASLVNAASLAQGSIAPGEIITIFGNGAGPSSPANLTFDSSGNVATTLQGTRVLFDGVPAPLLYASSTQVNAVAPYEIAGNAVTTVQLDYNGTASLAWGIPVASSAPGIFTLDSSGQGAAAVLNQDNSLNTASNPAARGSAIQIFATGEGQTTPAGVTGSVTGSSPSIALAEVKVTIGGFDAPVQFAGSAPDSVSGLLQVNALVPAAVASGMAVPISITIGGVQSPDGVTIAVN
jgi:uncharacterized protein (TIGR03437 family)